jgi:hypothetical protein
MSKICRYLHRDTRRQKNQSWPCSGDKTQLSGSARERDFKNRHLFSNRFKGQLKKLKPNGTTQRGAGYQTFIMASPAQIVSLQKLQGSFRTKARWKP